MKVKAIEPMFTKATISLAHEIHRQLVSSSRKSRRRWADIFGEHPEAIQEVGEKVRSSQPTIHLPVVKEFVVEWARNMDWNLSPTKYLDGIEFQVPLALLAELKETGSVEEFTFILGDRASVCCATLGNNDHNLQFGLIINCPIWVELASHDEYAETFEKQLGVVVHHEMAHFQHQKTGARAELHAHIRGLAWVLSAGQLPTTRDSAIQHLEQEHSDIWQNPEAKLLFLEGGEPAWRLLRLWIHYYHKHKPRSE
jgi:hypothetical protein